MFRCQDGVEKNVVRKLIIPFTNVRDVTISEGDCGKATVVKVTSVVSARTEIGGKRDTSLLEQIVTLEI